jgi:hypothetical protein
MRIKIITRSRILGFQPIDVYMNWPFHFGNMTFIEYFTKYEFDKLKHPFSKWLGEDNLGNYIYTTNKLTRFTDFHPTHNIEGFFYNILLKKCVFEQSLIYFPHPICKKLCTWMPHLWTCTWFRKIQMYLMKYAHINFLEVEKWSQILQEILDEHSYIDMHHETFETILPTINEQSHEINIRSKPSNTHLTQTFQWCN